MKSGLFAARGVPVVLAAFAGCGGGGPATPPGEPYAVTVGVDVTTTYQTMVGFGAASAYFSNWPAIHPQSAAIYQTLFNDLGLQVLRIGNWYQNNGDNEGSFKSTVQLVQGATAALGGHPPVILMSSWNPPYTTWPSSDGSTMYASLKSNNVNNNGGTLPKTASGGGYDYADFGTWWAESLKAYAAAGVVPDYVSIQNEPDFTTKNEGTCLFDPSEDATNAGYGPALDAVRMAVSSAPGLAVPKFIGPETDGIANGRIPAYVEGISSTGQLGDLDAIAHHLYNGGTAASPNSFNGSLSGVAEAAGDRPTWMTEYAPNSPNMFDTAWLIQNSVTVEGVSTYLYWDLFWPAPTPGSESPPQGLVSIESPSDPTTWQTTDGFFINDVYYAIQHFAKWIGIGWRRVAATASSGGINVSAFLSPDAMHLTLVLINTDGAEHQIAIDPGNADAGTPAFGTTAVYRTSGTAERAAPLGPLLPGNALVMPALSIATVTFGP